MLHGAVLGWQVTEDLFEHHGVQEFRLHESHHVELLGVAGRGIGGGSPPGDLEAEGVHDDDRLDVERQDARHLRRDSTHKCSKHYHLRRNPSFVVAALVRLGDTVERVKNEELQGVSLDERWLSALHSADTHIADGRRRQVVRLGVKVDSEREAKCVLQ